MTGKFLYKETRDYEKKRVLLLEGTIAGYNWAIVEDVVTHKRAYWGDRYKFRFLVDISKHRIWVDKVRESLTPKPNIYFGNQSPSLWDNGYGRCDYYCDIFLGFRNSREIIEYSIETGFSTKSNICLNDIANNLFEEFRPISIELNKYPILPLKEEF